MAPPEVKSVCDFLVRSQGEFGQWWWFYSTRAPKVIEGYPVYSVHQDAMAMMALLPATRVGAGDYLDALGNGLRWVTGHNELGQSLVDGRAGLIHRAIQRRGGDCDGLAGWSRPQRGAAYVAALTGRPRSAPSEFERLTECRSYHLGGSSSRRRWPAARSSDELVPGAERRRCTRAGRRRARSRRRPSFHPAAVRAGRGSTPA